MQSLFVSADHMYADAEYSVLPREIEGFEREVQNVLYGLEIGQKIWNTRKIGAGLIKWTWNKAQQPSPPIASMDFEPESFDRIGREETTSWLLGVSKDFRLTNQMIDSVRSNPYKMEGSLLTLYTMEFLALIGHFKERVIFNGANARDLDPGVINANIVGIMQTTGLSTFEGGIGLDDGIKDVGDVYASCLEGAGDLIENGYVKPFSVVMTPKVYVHAMKLRNATSGKTDMDYIHESDMFNQVLYTKELLTVAETTTNGVILVCANATPTGQPVAEIITSYEPAVITKSYINGLIGKVITNVGVAVYRPLGITKAVALDSVEA